MDNWIWAHYTIMIIIIIEFFGSICAETFKVIDGEKQRGLLCAFIIVKSVYTVFYVYMLHVGGFW